MNGYFLKLGLVFSIANLVFISGSWAESVPVAPHESSPSPRPQTDAKAQPKPFQEIPKDQLPELGDLAGLLEKGAVVFSMHNCPNCDVLAQKLEELGIPFKKITLATKQEEDTDADKENLEKYRPILKNLFKDNPGSFAFPAVLAQGKDGSVRIGAGNPFHKGKGAKPGSEKIFDEIKRHN
ncbi:MAG: hypothetical protein ACKN9V_02980 [Pseudomonadota bacterium]